MSQYKPFVLRLELGSSVILGHRLTLDGLLASLIFDRTQSVQEAHEAIPLARHAGVWAGSAALMEGPAPIRQVSIIQALKARIDLTPDMVAPGKRGYPRIEEARGRYRNKMTNYAAYDATALWFAGFGDIDRVKELVEHVPAVGAKRTSGHGKVIGVDIDDGESEDAGFVYTDGTPARPIPEEIWNERGRRKADMALEAWRAPYWSGERVLCALPAHSVVTRGEAKRLVGA